ncbi:MAG: aminomethyl-transferring glycine dehydrogenase subunit GcvPB [Pseudomonadota bacterium]
MKTPFGKSGLILNEKLLWEKGKKGKSGFSFPRRDVGSYPVNDRLSGPAPDFPDLSEVEVVRHYTRLSQWNFGLDTGMYPLGSCTMKYNPKINEVQAALPGFANAHPMVPAEQMQGALKLIYNLEHYLAEITGMDAVSLQPAAGAHGELTGMLMFSAFHRKKGQPRSKIIIPDTAHGTNPASAAFCGFKAVPIKSNENGILSPDAVAAAMDKDTAGIMVTNPNTLGLFEENIKEIADIVHSRGGLVYGDGANMNAVMGIVDMGGSGIDILHLNLHKTFSTPHGGGGPGAGPICVKEHLRGFLPVPRVALIDDEYVLKNDFPESIGRVHGFFGNFGVLIKAYSYILSMGKDLKRASQLAVLSANYIREQVKDILHLPYDKPCMHECVFSDKNLQTNHISTLDMAKRLIDYGFHPPTIYFPLVVQGAMMIEPTETESKEDIDHLIEALRAIVKEAGETPELLKEAPHCAKMKRLDETEAARKPCLTG